MKMNMLRSALTGLLAASVLAASQVASRAAEVDDQTRERVQAQIRNLLPAGEITSMAPSVVPGLLEVAVGTRLYYVSADGNYLISGQMIDMRDGSNVTRERGRKLVAAKVNTLENDRMIVFGPDDAAHRVTVFTDVDCPYCRKFHQDVPALNEADVQVRYLLFPRSGLNGESYRKSVGVWCADDPRESIGIAKAGGDVAYVECENPVRDHWQLGRDIGIRGTPTILLDDGSMIGGYVPPERLLEEVHAAGGS